VIDDPETAHEPLIIEADALPQPILRPQIVVPVSFALSVFVAILLSAFWPAAWPRFFSVHPFATAVIVAAIAIPVAIVGRRLWVKKRDRERSDLMKEGRQLAIPDRFRALLLSQQDYSDREMQVTSALGRDGVGNVVALLGKSRDIGKSPIEVPFEPLPLDESSPAFQSLASMQASGARSQNAHERSPGPLGLPLAWRRRLRLGAGWVVIACFAFNLVIASIKAWQIGKPTMEQMWWLGFFILMLWGVGGFGAWRSTDQWLLVPGGVVRRSAKSRSSEWKLHLFTRAQAFLLITEGRRRNCQVCVADMQESATATLTIAEAELLLRTWLSPLPPPSAEQLTDLS
jgi:hypothetical protein